MSALILKINFCDFYKEFNKEDNFFTRIIEKYYEGYEISEKPDFLFYSCYGTDHLKYRHCVKIFYTAEPVTPDFNECDYAVGYDWISFEDRYFRRPIWLTESSYFSGFYDIDDDKALNRRFCNFIYSNSNNGEGAIFRKKFAIALSRYKKVDCPGKVLHNMDATMSGREDKEWKKSKVDFISQYKFTIAFENTSMIGYSTEKMLHPLIAKSIPIYWGDPCVEREFNESALIYCNQYNSDIDSIVERVVELDRDDEKYLAVLHQNPMREDFNKDEILEFEKWVIHIFEKGNNPFNKDSISLANRMSIRNLSRKDKLIYFLKK